MLRRGELSVKLRMSLRIPLITLVLGLRQKQLSLEPRIFSLERFDINIVLPSILAFGLLPNLVNLSAVTLYKLNSLVFHFLSVSGYQLSFLLQELLPHLSKLLSELAQLITSKSGQPLELLCGLGRLIKGIGV